MVDPAPTGPAGQWPRSNPTRLRPSSQKQRWGERVWLVWEAGEVLGIYADPDSAAADCAALRRHAQRERLDVRYDWMAVPVFGGRHHHPPATTTPRWRW